MSVDLIYRENDNLIQATVTDEVSGAVVTTATVTAELTDSAGAQIGNETWPVSMVHAGSGVYRATLKDDLTLAGVNEVKAKVVADDGPGRKSTTYCKLFVTERSI